MNKLLAALICFSIALVAGCELTQEVTQYDISGSAYLLPPPQYRYGGMQIVHFEAQAGQTCWNINPNLGRVDACAEVGNNIMWVPNPCLWQGDSYADLLCHEMGHTNGWPQDHTG